MDAKWIRMDYVDCGAERVWRMETDFIVCVVHFFDFISIHEWSDHDKQIYRWGKSHLLLYLRTICPRYKCIENVEPVQQRNAETVRERALGKKREEIECRVLLPIVKYYIITCISFSLMHFNTKTLKRHKYSKERRNKTSGTNEFGCRSSVESKYGVYSVHCTRRP